MKRLQVTSQLGDQLVAGLLSIARADGVVKPEEMSALRAIAAELGLPLPAADELLLADEMTPGGLSYAISGGGAYREGEASAPEEIGRSFIEGALRLALSDGELVSEEVDALRAYAAALGVATAAIPGWSSVGEPDVTPVT